MKIVLTLWILASAMPGIAAAPAAGDEKTVADLDTPYQAAVAKNDAAAMDVPSSRLRADVFGQASIPLPAAN